MKLEGILFVNTNGRFEFSNYELTSGSVCEILINGEWVNGRIEHVFQHGYAFYAGPNETYVKLIPGMRARVIFS